MAVVLWPVRWWRQPFAQIVQQAGPAGGQWQLVAGGEFGLGIRVADVYGNATPADARELLEEFMAPLLSTGSTALHRSQMDAARVVQLPTGIEWVNTSAVPNADETNSSIEVYFQVGPFDPHVQAALSVLANIIKEPAFDQLRTKEQLGYIVHTSTKSQYGVNGLRIIVQSHVKHPNGLDTRIEAFLEAFREFSAKEAFGFRSRKNFFS